VIWALVRILKTGNNSKCLNRLETISGAGQLAESAVQSIMSVLQTGMIAHGKQAPGIQLPLLTTNTMHRRRQHPRLQLRGQRPLYEVRVECGGHARTDSQLSTPLRLSKAAPARETARPEGATI
jgi:hypothetical protein